MLSVRRSTAAFFLLLSLYSVQAQSFRVQLAAYSQRLPEEIFKERGIETYSERVDISGIYWYSAGNYDTREAAEAVQQDALNKGFPNALIFDEAAMRVLSEVDCPYIHDGVVFVEAPTRDPSKYVIYFDFAQSGLDAESKAVLDEVYQTMVKTPALVLKIQGFTDGVGDGQVNLKLAGGRSRSARDYLIYKGVRADRMVMEVFGEAEPAAPNAEDDGSVSGKGRDLPENRKWNRRVTLIVQ
jgi:outer membrane protein OmpA-like peptidoglycan-associated protein